LEGRVVVASDSGPTSNAQVLLTGTACWGWTDTAGRYEITNIPSGHYRVRVYGIGLHPSDTLEVDIKPAMTTTLDVVMGDGPWYVGFDEEWLAACTDAVLRPGAPSLSSADSLGGVVLCTTLAVVRFEFSQSRPTYCFSLGSLLPADTTLLLRRISAVGARVHPPADCRAEGSGLSAFLVDARGRPAIAVELREPTVVGSAASSVGSLYAAPLWAKGWRCEYVRRLESWHVEKCYLEWIS
jgi:hypothetical protein